MCQPEAHWFLGQKILLCHSLQISLNKKTMFVNSDVSDVNTSTKIVINLVSVGIVVQCYIKEL